MKGGLEFPDWRGCCYQFILFTSCPALLFDTNFAFKITILNRIPVAILTGVEYIVIITVQRRSAAAVLNAIFMTPAFAAGTFVDAM